MASYSIDPNHKRGFVRITVDGEAGIGETREIITQARTAAADHQLPLLYDLRSAVARVSLAEWFHLPRELDVLREEKTLRTRVAALVGNDVAQRAGYELYELATHNLGLSVRIFEDEDLAVAWLTEPRSIH